MKIRGPIICTLWLSAFLALSAGCGPFVSPAPTATPTPTSQPTPLVTQTPPPGPPGTISGTVFRDENDDGVYSPELDIPIGGAVVSARFGDMLIAANRTDGMGEYAVTAPSAAVYTLEVSLPSPGETYDPEPDAWSSWSAVKGHRTNVPCPSDAQDISVEYRMLNYGPGDFQWELWHEGPLFDHENVVLVHGFKLPSFSGRGYCDDTFADLDNLLQAKAYGYNVWQFEYGGPQGGTPEPSAVYAERLGQALHTVSQVTGKDASSVVAHSLGGIISRLHIASQGKSRVARLITIATPHLGITQFQPFDIYWMYLLSPSRPQTIGPGAALELRPDSRLLWDLNTDVEGSVVPEFASIAGFGWDGHTDGLVEVASASLVESNPDGSVAQRYYFAGVDRLHAYIIDIRSEDDEVFRLVASFLRGGVQGISALRPPEHPNEYDGHPGLTFALTDALGLLSIVFPFVTVENTGHRYWSFEIFSQGATTEEGAQIYTVPVGPDEDGETRIYYLWGEHATVRIERGQSTVVKRPIGAAP